MSVCRFALILVSAAATLRAEIPSWSRHLSEAARLENAGELAGAASEFASALRDAHSAGPESAAAGHVLDAMGAFYDDIGNFNQAEACLEESLRIWRGLLGPGHMALVRVVNRLAAVYLEDGNLGKAERLDLPQWLERLRAQPAASDGLVPLLQNLATLESRRGRFERARSLFQEALERLQQGSIVDAATRNDFGLACLRARQYGAAVELLTASLTLWEKLRGSDSLAAGTTAYNLALAYEASGRFPEAEARVEVALHIAEKRIGANSLRTAEVLAANARLLRKLHRKSEARRILARAARIMREQEPQPGSYTIDVSELSMRSR